MPMRFRDCQGGCTWKLGSFVAARSSGSYDWARQASIARCSKGISRCRWSLARGRLLGAPCSPIDHLWQLDQWLGAWSVTRWFTQFRRMSESAMKHRNLCYRPTEPVRAGLVAPSRKPLALRSAPRLSANRLSGRWACLGFKGRAQWSNVPADQARAEIIPIQTSSDRELGSHRSLL